MLPAALWLLCLSILDAKAATTTTSNEFYSSSISTFTTDLGPSFTGTKFTYATSNGQVSIESSSSSSSSEGQSTRSTTTRSLTTLGGGNGTATSTTSSAEPRNTVPCNGHPQFCNRSYSNITHVCAHNSAFSIPNNAGSNQEFSIWYQLNDGIRMLQGEALWVNDTVMNCHTTCDLLNAGPWEGSLEVLVDWLQRNPYEVVTWLIANRDFREVEDFLPAIKKSGLLPHLYEPTYVPQRLDQWPTLGEMIISGKRVVMFMDYKANQSKVPYILDEFTHMFETPFSPQDKNFPCTNQRPPGLSKDAATDKYMYIANHNLNTAVDLSALIGGNKDNVILIPNTAEINNTNGRFNTLGQLEAMSQNCTKDWGRPPNFLLVDYYNRGDPKPGSVFEVAARANNVSYQGNCCGTTSGATRYQMVSAILILATIFVGVCII